MGKYFGIASEGLTERHRELRRQRKQFEERVVEEGEKLKEHYKNLFNQEMEKRLGVARKTMEQFHKEVWDETLQEFPEAVPFKDDGLSLNTKTGELQLKKDPMEQLEKLFEALERDLTDGRVH